MGPWLEIGAPMHEAAHAGITRVRDCLVVALPRQLDEQGFADIGERLRRAVQAQHARSVVVDASGLQVLDSEEFTQLMRVLRSVELLGAHTMLVGLPAGIAAHLVNQGVRLGGLRTARSVEDGLDQATRWRGRS